MTTKTVLDSGYTVNEYTAAKYLQRDKEVSLHDVLNLVRPAPRDENRKALFRRIATGELSDYDTEPLRQETTWEAERSSDTTDFTFDMSEVPVGEETELTNGPVTLTIDEWGDTSVDVRNGEQVDYVWDDEADTITITTELDADEEWRQRLPDMGIMARVRNLRNMREAGLGGGEIFDYDPDNVVFGDESERIVRNSKMFPFRYYQAFTACGDVNVGGGLWNDDATFDIGRGDLLDEHSQEWLTSAIDVAAENLPDTVENTLTAVDL